MARRHGEYRASVVLALNYDSGFALGEPSQKDLRLLYPHVKCPAPKAEVSEKNSIVSNSASKPVAQCFASVEK